MVKILKDVSPDAVVKPVGIAAPQVGLSVQIIVIRYDTMTIMPIINPIVLQERDHQWSYERCLSVPGEEFRLKRPKQIKVAGYNVDGSRSKVIKGFGMLAAILSHEIDHLSGILISDVGVSNQFKR